MATGLDCPLHIYDGDIIQLYCPNESGYVYSEPRSPQKESDAIVICSKEDFLLNDFTEFCITLKKVSDEKLHSECGVQVVERIAYGSIVYLEHQASMKFMTVHDENNVSLLKLNTQGKVKNSGIQGDKKKKMFRILSPCQKLAWGKELKNNDAFMLESISCDSLMVHFSYNPQDNGYKPSLKPMGTVFIINLHCHMRLKQNPKSIKGGSLVYLASLLEMEAYIHGTGSFISSNYSVTKGGHAIEEPHEFKNPNLGPDWQLLECISETSKVGLIKFNEGNFKMLPQLGDTFFKIEKVSEERAGDPILFGEQCRIRHLFTLKYICVHEKNNVINIVLCDKECDHGRSIFKILPVSNPAHKKEVSCSDKVIFENIKTSTMYLSVNLKPHSLMDQAAIDQAAMDQAAMDHPLTLCRDRDVSRNQFEILQIEDYLVLRSYKYMVIGSLFKKSQNVIKDITKLKSEEEISMMRKLMGDEIFEAIRKHDEQPLSYDKQNEKNDEIDLHIKKIIYEKIWKHTEELKLIATILLKDNIEMLTEKGEMRTKIEKQMTCLENYFKQCETGVSTAKQSRDQVAIDIEVINDPQAQELLQLFHLFYKKHELSANYDEKDKSAETRDLSAENQQKLCKILSQLISIEKSDISYMSAWLLFEIYTKGKSHSTEDSRKEERSHSSDSTEDSWIKLQLSTMIAKGNSLLKQILTSSMDADSIEELNKLAKSCIDLHEVEVPEPNHARQTEAVGQTEVPNFKRQIEAPNFERQTKAFESGDVVPIEPNYKEMIELMKINEETISKKATVSLCGKSNESEDMWHYCLKWSKSVEIIHRENENSETLTRVYFPCDPDIHIKDKNRIQQSIKRSTPQEKLIDLLAWTEAVKADNSEQKNKLRKSKFIHLMFLKTKNARDFLLAFLTVFLNLLILLTVETPPGYNMPGNNICTTNETSCNITNIYFQPIPSPDIPLWSTIILSIIGFLHAILALLMVIEYFARNGGHLRFHLRNTFLKILITCNRRSSELEQPQSNEYFVVPILSFQPIYRIIFMFCSIVAWIPYPTLLRYLYCVCMLYPFLGFDVVLYILKALRKSLKQLFVVLLLCFVIMYIYAVISFALLNNYFSEDKDQFCGTLLQCFFTVSRLGFLTTLGSELDIRPSNDYESNFTLYFLRTFYDIIFFIVVTTLSLNIAIAILVDRFSAMREKKEDIEEDIENRCFICSIEKSEFDKRKKDFKKHVKEEHNMWNYILFIIHVQNLPENEHNALEKYISEKIRKMESEKTKNEDQKSIDFFPIFRAKSLPDYKAQAVVTPPT
uniref:Ion transport domain-containing protein n=1 Tax=Amphimedon queenslandica TaxID=400682 RepID=A0A1X7TN28_AMPQE